MRGDQLEAATSAATPTPPLGLPRATWARDTVAASAGPGGKPSIKLLSRGTHPIVASQNNGGRLGNYADPVAEAGVSRSWRPPQQFRQQK
jgi:hypothetical protein